VPGAHALNGVRTLVQHAWTATLVASDGSTWIIATGKIQARTACYRSVENREDGPPTTLEGRILRLAPRNGTCGHYLFSKTVKSPCPMRWMYIVWAGMILRLRFIHGV